MNRFERLEDVQNLIDSKIKESLTLEYKRELGSNNNEIAKDLSAFANTSDGVIIYGTNEKDGLPTSLNWIESKGTKERIENIILSSIQPRIEGVKINSIQNPDNPSQGIFIVYIPESPEAPHMANHRYYKRHNFQSVPMEDYEVKGAMFKKGLKNALDFEISQNLELADKTSKLIEEIFRYRREKRIPIAFIPFYTEAWRLIVGSGLLFILKGKSTKLVEVYSLIHEINCLIDYQKSGVENVVPIPESNSERGEHMPGIYIPTLLHDYKLPKLRDLLREIEKEFIED